MSITIVTGAGGFIGSFLVQELEKKGQEVVSVYNTGSTLDFSQNNSESISIDISNINAFNKIIEKYQPSKIYHLAAQSSPENSWLDSRKTINVNFIGTLNLIQSVIANKVNPKIVVVSSSSVYGLSNSDKPINESFLCNPNNPYGLSKLAAEQLCYLFSIKNGLSISVARPFFIIGPKKRGDVCSDWARNIVQIERGLKKDLDVGSLTNTRDFLDVHDAVLGLMTIMEKGKSGEVYNICSNRGIALSEISKLLISFSLYNFDIPIKVFNNKIRSVDSSTLIGDNSKLKLLGWNHHHLIENTLREILDYWRNFS